MAKNPVYIRIQDDLAARISAGEYPAGSRIPSESALAERYGVTRMTVRQAVDGLVFNGVVSRRQGSGTYVVQVPTVHRPLNRLTGFTEDVRNQGHVTSTSELSRSQKEPPDDVRDFLQLDEGAHTVRLERLRYLDDEPVALHQVWLPLSLAPDLAREPLPRHSLYAVLEEDYGIRLGHARQRITAVAAEAWHAKHLAVPIAAPLLLAQRQTFDDTNRPVEYVKAWSRPELPLEIELQR